MKTFIIIELLLLCTLTADAQTVQVKAIDKISTEKSTTKTALKIQNEEPIILSNYSIIEQNSIITGNLINIKKPKRLKRDAKFSYQITGFTPPSGKTQKVTTKEIAKYHQPINKGDLCKRATLTASNLILPGASIILPAIDGAVKNEENDRVKSSITEAYEFSPLSFIKKGKHIKFEKGETFFLKLPNPN